VGPRQIIDDMQAQLDAKADALAVANTRISDAEGKVRPGESERERCVLREGEMRSMAAG
jgi:hypothetical protein